MKREWKQGDVAMLPDGFVAVVDGDLRFVYGSGAFKWAYPDSINGRAARPLVVIDPEDREQVERLAKAYDDEARAYVIEQSYLQYALREFANPTPATVYEHFVVRTGIDRLVINGKRQPLRSVCGKTWTPDDSAVSAGRCPDCESIIESGWTR